jgi:hypothetical protein
MFALSLEGVDLAAEEEGEAATLVGEVVGEATWAAEEEALGAGVAEASEGEAAEEGVDSKNYYIML